MRWKEKKSIRRSMPNLEAKIEAVLFFKNEPVSVDELSKWLGEKSDDIKKILVLGLGAGSIVKVINKYFPKSKITAVEIDPMMVEIGKKHFDLEKARNLEIIIGDAFNTSLFTFKFESAAKLKIRFADSSVVISTSDWTA